MHTTAETNPLVAFIFTILLVVAVLIGSTASNQSMSGGLSASSGSHFGVTDRS